MPPLTTTDPHLTALLAAAYRLGYDAGSHGAGVARSAASFVAASGGLGGGAGVVGAEAPAAAPTSGPVNPPVTAGSGSSHNSDLASLLVQQNIAATLRDDALRSALSQSEQRRQALEMSRWAQLASMRGTPTRSWLADTAGQPFRF